MDKEKLDNILELHKAQPVGHGYIDIIVSRDNYDVFIADLVKNGFKVKSISWWEWCPNEKESDYGLGGPKSIYYDGWFSELSVDIDDIKLYKEGENEILVREITDRIKTKSISFPSETVTFKQNNWLTPAIWLDVPSNWRNKYYA
jgi:hypothetical protein